MKHGQSFKTMAITINGNGTVTGISVGGLPDGIVDTDTLAANAVTAAKASGSTKGITEADHWRVTSSFDASDTIVDSNWERVDTNSFLIGSGMSESSGVFTFPTTGLYLIKFTFHAHSSTQTRYAGGQIQVTTDNSSYAERAAQYTSIASDSNAYAGGSTLAFFDVTNTTTHKVKFKVTAENSMTWNGDTNRNFNHVVFIRLGDT